MLGRIFGENTKKQKKRKKVIEFVSQFFNGFFTFFLSNMGPQIGDFKYFFENVNFTKNSVSPQREPNFSGSEPRKISAKLVEK